MKLIWNGEPEVDILKTPRLFKLEATGTCELCGSNNVTLSWTLPGDTDVDFLVKCNDCGITEDPYFEEVIQCQSKK